MRIAALLLATMVTAVAHAQPPAYVSYRAALVLDDGRTVPDGSYELVFSIHDAPDSGNLLFSQVKTVHAKNGWYEVHLVDEPGAPLLEALSGSPRFLEVEIRSGNGFVDQILSPRQQLSSAPWALVAGEAESTGEPPNSLPVSAIVLWDQGTGCAGAAGACPCGFTAATEFGGRAALGGLDDPANTPGGSTGVPSGSGDVLTANELPSHTHELASAGLHRHGLFASHVFVPQLYLMYEQGLGGGWDGGGDHKLIPSDTVLLSSAGSHGHVIGTAGDDGPHYHPFRTVLLCRKDAP